MHPRKDRTRIWTKLRFLYSPYCLAAAILAITSLSSDFTKEVKARFSPIEKTAHVFIDGKNYGTFEHINELSDLTSKAMNPDEGFIKVNLKRDFVTAPSLSTWAYKSAARPALTDIRLVMKSKNGKKGASYILRLCKPLSWSLEESGPALGGFHEKIELAVQEIAIY